MFGQCNAFRGNTTPKERLRWAKEELDYANRRLDEAQKRFDEAVREVDAHDERWSQWSQAAYVQQPPQS